MKKIFMLSILALSTMTGYAADTMPTNGNTILSADTSTYMMRKNTLSNIEFCTTNYGIFGLNVPQNSGGTFWPRNSQNQYIFGGGVWFGAQKKKQDAEGNSTYRKMTVISYDPSVGGSWLVPGYIEEGNAVREDLKNKNGVYVSTDYNRETGIPIEAESRPNWCLWKINANGEFEYGTPKYTNVASATNRDYTTYPQGPLFVSDEDFVSSYKDTDLSKYKIGSNAANNAGYPLGLQFEERVMSWNTTGMQDAMVVFYTIENKSNDTLINCRIGSMLDFDIAAIPITTKNSSNDRLRYLSEYPNMNLTVAWSDSDYGDGAIGLGYMGVSLIETPAVDANGFIRKDKSIFFPEEQVGLSAVKIWDIAEDVKTDTSKYDLLSTGIIETDTSRGDKRLLTACGAFNMLPGDKARFAVAINFALPAKGGEADGTIEDLTGFTGNGKMDALSSNSGSLIGNLNNLRTEYYKAIKLSVDDETVTTIMLGDVYPNPTTKAINVNYNLTIDGDVSIGIYDQLGNEVQTLTNGHRSSGSQSEMFQLSTELFSNGMYYLRVKTASGTAVKVISIVK